jgi:hypothetical protein
MSEDKTQRESHESIDELPVEKLTPESGDRVKGGGIGPTPFQPIPDDGRSRLAPIPDDGRSRLWASAVLAR